MQSSVESISLFQIYLVHNIACFCKCKLKGDVEQTIKKHQRNILSNVDRIENPDEKVFDDDIPSPITLALCLCKFQVKGDVE
jgi:hypothetical protein